MNPEDEFERRLRESVRDSIPLGYNPTRFADMLDKQGGVGTARRLVASGELQDGLRQVIELGRPDLAMESIMLEPQFASLFTSGQLDAARWRLAQVS